MLYCSYYQAHISEKEAWFLVALLRSFEHLAFDRTLSKSESIFEFFVPEGQEQTFLELMHALEARHIVTDLKQLPNRLREESV